MEKDPVEKKPKKRVHGEAFEQVDDDAEMQPVKERKIVKAKRRVEQVRMLDEDGQELSFEDDDDDWEDEDEIDEVVV